MEVLIELTWGREKVNFPARISILVVAKSYMTSGIALTGAKSFKEKKKEKLKVVRWDQFVKELKN